MVARSASQGKSTATPKQTAPNLQSYPKNSARNVRRGVWELARLHIREAWLCWYPAGMSALGFLLWLPGDLCDRNLDIHVTRCKVRPLPAGMLTVTEAIAAFIAWIPVTLAITYYTLGDAGFITFLPIWVLSLIYPFMKRLIPFPQIILGAIIGGAVFPGWVSITHELSDWDQALPLFAATMSWVIYFDVFYASQVFQPCFRLSSATLSDSFDGNRIALMTRKWDIKSLAVLLGDRAWIFLAFLGLLQVCFFAVTALKAHMSIIFWVFGLGVWAVNIPWHVLSLDQGNRNSGGKIFKANIMLGLYMTAVTLVELLVTRVYLQVGRRVVPSMGR
ncbi:hypothetical protein MMC29_001587 [Sticta canariensis]|nr:hypothetical protein [Sticta canariensis]